MILPIRPIQVLSSDLANKIAAGEVIERPASVVKELVENAIDAGATKIEVEVRDGGKEYIRVTDNGRGIGRDQLPIAFLRHATSKITSVEELTEVLSLGFRGEALPSIASCAEVEMTSCPVGAEAARIVIRGGIAEPVSSAAGALGTSVVVRRLFFNTPARFKFLKQSATEKRYIAEYVTNMALAHPEVAFHLVGDNALLLHSPGSSDLLAAIGAVHGAAVAKMMIPVAWESPFVSVSGYTSPPSEARPTRAQETLFVNGRWVQNRLLYAAIEKGYDNMLGHRRYPISVLHLNIDPSLLDVNVHPAKTEIRFRHEGDTFKHVMLAVRGALTGANLAPHIASDTAQRGFAGVPDRSSYTHIVRTYGLPGAASYTQPAPANYPPTQQGYPVQAQMATVADEAAAPGDTHSSATATSLYVNEAAATSEWPARDHQVGATPTWQATKALGETPAADAELPTDFVPNGNDHALLAHMRAPLAKVEVPDDAQAVKDYLRQATVLGQVLNTYLAVAVPFGLWLIDQHVAHERVLFEQVLARPVDAAAQMLLVPVTIQLTPAEAALVEGTLNELASLGFVLEPFGASAFLARAMPLQLNKPLDAAALRELLIEIAAAWENTGPTRRERAAAMVACKGAIKAGRQMERVAQVALLHSLARVENPFACPHGRPIIIALGREELERRFGRR